MDSGSSQAIGAARDITPPGSRRSRRRRRPTGGPAPPAGPPPPPPRRGPRRGGRRGRPTGEPPPLPRHLESTGVGWMVAALGLIALTLLVFTAGRYGRGVSFAVVDNWVVQRLAAIRTP